MRIVHAAEAFGGGIVAFVKSLVDNMPDDQHIIIYGRRPQVTDFKALRNSFLHKNVHFICWRSACREINPVKDTRALIELYRILKRLRKGGAIDAVHLHSSKSGFLGRLVCRLLGFNNVIYTPNGAPFLVGANRFTNFVYRKLERMAYRFGGQIVSCSQSEQHEYKKAGMNTVTINNGIAFADEIIPRRLDAGGRFRILTSGRILNQKDPALFNQIAYYFKDFPQFEFIWAGDGPERALLTSPNITVTGWLPREDVKSLIESAHVYLSTARFEGLPYAVLEAMALRRPVLLSNSTGNCDLVKNYVNGDLFVNNHEAIIKLMQYANNRSMLHVMGEYSAHYGRESFNLTQTLAQYKILYQGRKLSVTDNAAWGKN